MQLQGSAGLLQLMTGQIKRVAGEIWQVLFSMVPQIIKNRSTASRVQKDELDVQRIIDTLISWNNPFAEGGKQMPSLSSGVQATPNVQSDLLIR